jgi:hypothetical protein
VTTQLPTARLSLTAATTLALQGVAERVDPPLPPPAPPHRHVISRVLVLDELVPPGAAGAAEIDAYIAGLPPCTCAWPELPDILVFPPEGDPRRHAAR